MARLSLALALVAFAVICGAAVGLGGASRLRAQETRAASSPTPAAKPAPTAEPPAKARTKKGGVREVRDERGHAVVEQPWVPFAKVDGLPLVHPADRVERLGFHQASDPRTVQMVPLGSAVRPKLLPSRGRGTNGHSAVDIVVHPTSVIRSPVDGVVKRAGTYNLYCKTPDAFIVISPDKRPDLEVKILHVSGLRVRAGDRLEAGRTAIAKRPTKLPFGSQVDAFTAEPSWPHVHLETARLAVPDARPQPGAGLALGC